MQKGVGLRPASFSLNPTIGENGVEDVHDIDAVEDRWYDPNAEYFKVRTSEGKRYILRSDGETGQWTLQSGFDGAELLARAGIEFVTVEPAAIRRALTSTSIPPCGSTSVFSVSSACSSDNAQFR